MPLLLALLALVAGPGAPARGAPAPASSAPATPPAPAPGDAAAREAAIRSYLGVIDEPVPADTWRALGPEAVPVLARIAGDAAELPSRRAVALEGLAALGGPGAEAAHLAALRDARAPRLVRLGAIRGLGRLLPPDRLAGALLPALDERDAGLRATAARVLAEGAPDLSCGAIRARAARPGERARLARALATCDR